MRIEEGKFYRAANGERVGPVEHWGLNDVRVRYLEGDGKYWYMDGKGGGYAYGNDLVAEWTEGPIRTETVTVRRLEPGVYGPLRVWYEINVPDCERPDDQPEKRIEVSLVHTALNASDWRELARVALEIAEYLENVD